MGGVSQYGVPLIEGFAQGYAGYNPYARQQAQMQKLLFEQQQNEIKEQKEAQEQIHVNRAKAQMAERAALKMRDAGDGEGEKKAWATAMQGYGVASNYGDRKAGERLKEIRNIIDPVETSPQTMNELKAQTHYEAIKNLPPQKRVEYLRSLELEPQDNKFRQDLLKQSVGHEYDKELLERKQKHAEQMILLNDPATRLLTNISIQRRNGNEMAAQRLEMAFDKQYFKHPKFNEIVTGSVMRGETSLQDASRLLGKYKPEKAKTKTEVEAEMMLNLGLDKYYETIEKAKQAGRGEDADVLQKQAELNERKKMPGFLQSWPYRTEKEKYTTRFAWDHYQKTGEELSYVDAVGKSKENLQTAKSFKQYTQSVMQKCDSSMFCDDPMDAYKKAVTSWKLMESGMTVDDLKELSNKQKKKEPFWGDVFDSLKDYLQGNSGGYYRPKAKVTPEPTVTKPQPKPTVTKQMLQDRYQELLKQGKTHDEALDIINKEYRQ